MGFSSLLYSIFFLSIVAQISAEQDKFSGFEHHQKLSDHVELFWTINPEREDIIIGLKYFDAPGWVGFGISQTGSMKGADIVILRKDKLTGNLVLEDRHATDFVQPVLDENQNVYLFWSYQDIPRRYTELIYSRPLESCDSDFDRKIDVKFESTVIFAYGVDHTLQYHGTSNRGIVEVFWKPQEILQPQAREDGTTSVVIRSPPFTSTPQKTTYFCSYITVNITGKHHVIAVKPLVEHPEIVHHMVLYRCYSPHETNSETFKCQMDDCYSFWTGWAVGGRENFLPPDVGLPLGDGEECSSAGCAKYLRLEVHYENPNALVGLVDTSGFELIISPTLRKYDQGILIVGTPLEAIAIPPYLDSWEIANVCPSECLAKYLPEEGVTVRGNGFHMHQTGRAIWTQHIREGQEIAPLGNITQWDFNFQNSIPTDAVLLRGDSLVTHCVYDTSRRETVTKGGETSADEMCFNFIPYYPKTMLMGCIDLSYYTKNWVLCLQDSDGTDLTEQQWWDQNVLHMDYEQATTFEPYTPPVPCACNSSCWTIPEIPDWITTDSSPASFSSPLLSLLLSVVLIFFSF